MTVRGRDRFLFVELGEPGDIKVGTCDWGCCNEPAVGLREDRLRPGWLPVCAKHYEDNSELDGCGDPV